LFFSCCFFPLRLPVLAKENECSNLWGGDGEEARDGDGKGEGKGKGRARARAKARGRGRGRELPSSSQWSLETP